MILSNQGLQPDPFATNLGHLGGLITGFFIGFLITEQYDYEAEKKNRTPDRFLDEEYKN